MIQGDLRSNVDDTLKGAFKGASFNATIFQPAFDGLASDAGLDPQTKAAVEQERIKRREIENQFGKTPYGAVNLKKQAYLELARHDLQGALKLQEEAVKEEEKKAAKK